MPTTRAMKRKMEEEYEDEKTLDNGQDTEERTEEIPSSPPAPAPSVVVPIEVLRNTLKYADPSSLSRCMRVSKTFYNVAGPLLYSNVIIKEGRLMSSVLVGSRVYEKQARGSRKAVVNLKTTLLSYIQQLTIVSHTCNISTSTSNFLRSSEYFHDQIPVEPFDNLKTLVVIPYAACHETERLCSDLYACLILSRFRAQKLVIHNSRFSIWRMSNWPMCESGLPVGYSTLTLVLDETDCHVIDWERQGRQRMSLGGDLQHLRVIVNKTPAWLDKIAQRETCSTTVIDKQRLASAVLAPSIADAINSITVTIYLFREFDAYDIEVAEVKQALDRALSERYRNEMLEEMAAGYSASLRAIPEYTIKTLSDYIEEGVEDELLWQELKYWREENKRRLAKAVDQE